MLGQCPGVADVGVVGIPDGNGNDLPRAYVVVFQSNSAGQITEKDIHDFLNSRVSVYKRLRGGVVFVDEVPRNLNGKVMRNVLKEWAEKDGPGAISAKL